MRLHFVVLLSAMLLLFPLGGARAGSVLVPAGTNTPNLGLTPSQPVPAAADSAASGSGKENSPSDPTAGEKPVLPSMDSGPLPYTPAPITPVSPNGILQIPSLPVTQTMVVKEPDPAVAAAPAPGSPQPPYSLTVGLTTKSILGPFDLDQVADHLGIDKSQVASVCRLSLGGLLLTSKDPVVFESGSSPRADVRYDGAITNANIHVEALCAMGPVPPNKGVIIQMGDKYLVPLGSVSCMPPASTRSLKQLAVLYAGNGSGECRFE